MSNSVLTADIIAKEAVMQLENNCVMAKLVHRGHEDEFDKKVNGYEVGETVSIRRPADFVVTDGATAVVQDAKEGKTPFTVNKRKNIAFKFSSQDLTMKIGDLSERIIKPAMIQLAEQVDRDILGLYNEIPNSITVPSGGIDSFADFSIAAQRMDEVAVPKADRSCVLNATDYWTLVGSQTSLNANAGLVGDAWKKGSLGEIGGIDTYMTQNIPAHTYGARAGTDLVDIVGQSYVLGHEWDNVKDATYAPFHIDGFASDVAGILKKGDTFTISDVYDVNPVSKEPKAFLKQFVVMEDATSASSEGDVKIWPPIILSGAHKTAHLSTGTLEDNTVTYQGTASTAFRQNLYFHKNAFGLAMVPLVKPPGAVDVGRRSYKGFSVRIIPVYDGITDYSMWRCDILYGVKTLDPRLAVRASLAADIA